MTNLRDTSDYHDFVRALTEHAPLVELLDGQYAIHARAPYQHMQFAQELYLALDSYIDEQELAGDLLTDCEIVLGSHTILIADIAFTFKTNTETRIEDDAFIGAPDFVCEIVSDATRDFAAQEKFFAYLRAGVQEYWLVDPAAPPGERFTLYVRSSRSAAKALPMFRCLSGHDPRRSDLFAGIEIDDGLL